MTNEEELNYGALESVWDEVLAQRPEGEEADEFEPQVFAFNWPVVIGSFVVLPLIVGVLVFWHGRQLKNQTTAFLERALEAENEEDWHVAADWLGKYIKYEPSEIERVRNLADKILEQRISDRVTARRALNRALHLYYAFLEQRPRDLGARAKVAKILLMFDPSRSVSEVGEILRVEPNNVEALRVRAIGWDRISTMAGSSDNDKLQQAVTAYRELLELAPNDVENAYRFATLCREFSKQVAPGLNLSEAGIIRWGDKAMDRLVSDEPTNIAARIARFHYRYRYRNTHGDGEFVELDEDLRAVLEIDADNTLALIAAGAHFARNEPGDLIRRDRLEVASRFLRQAIEAKPKSYAPYLILARVSATLGKRDDAMEAISAGLREHQGNLSLLLARAELQIDLKQWSPALVTISELDKLTTRLIRRRLSPNHHQEVRLRRVENLTLHARWLLSEENPQQDISAAAETIDQILTEKIPLNFTSKVFQDLGVMCAVLGKWPQSVVAFTDACLAAPRAIAPRVQLVVALRRAGRLTDAITECERLLDHSLHKHYERVVRFEYAQLLMELEVSKPRDQWSWDAFDHAVEELRSFVGKDPQLALLELDARHVRAGRAAAESIAKSLRLLEGEFDSSEIFWRGAVDLYLRMERGADARRAVLQLETLSADSEQAPDNGEPPSSSNPNHQVVTAAARQFADEFRLALEEGRRDDAFLVLRKWRSQMPTSLQPRLALLKLAAQSRRDVDLEAVEGELRSLEGNTGALWRFARIQRYLTMFEAGDQSAIRKATEFASDWVRAQSNSVTARAALAMVQEASGRNEDAIESYKYVFNRGDRRLSLIRKLVGLLLMENLPEDANLFLEELPVKQQNDPGILPLVVEVKIKQQKFDAAIQTATEALDVFPQATEIHIALARALVARGGSDNVERAQDAIDIAVSLSPADFSVLTAAVHLSLSLKPVRTHVLEAYVRRARALLSAHDCPETAWQSMVLARCNQLQGAVKATESYFRRALKLDTGSTIRRWLPSGAVLTLNANPITLDLSDPIVWAAGRPTYQTLGILAGISGSSRATFLADDPRLRAIVELCHAGTGARHQAINLLSQIPDDQLTCGDHILLARLYEWEETSSDALLQLQLARSKAANFRTLSTITDMCIRYEHLLEAEETIARMTELAATDDQRIRLATLRTRLFVARRDVREAVSTGQATILRAATTQDKIAVANRVADILAQGGYVDQGRALLEQAVQDEPFHDMLMASWLSGQSGGKTEALALCTRIASAHDIEKAASLAVLCVQRGEVSAESASQANALVTRFFETGKPASHAFLANLSRWREIQHRIDEAISLARQALETQPNSTAVRNNLAWYRGVYQNEHAESIQEIDRLIRDVGPIDALLDTKGVLLLVAGMPTEAVRIIEVSTESGSPASTTYLHLAAAYLAAGRTGDAEKAMRRASTPPEMTILPFDRELADRLSSMMSRSN